MHTHTTLTGVPPLIAAVPAIQTLGERVAPVLLRGLRLKIGVDRGSVHASINSSTGRMAYR